MSSQKTQKSDDVGARARAVEESTADSPELTDPDRVRELIERQERTDGSRGSVESTGRRYECLDCGTTVDGFPSECPDCESTSFETTTAHEGTEFETPVAELFDVYAEFTAPYNPYVPR